MFLIYFISQCYTVFKSHSHVEAINDKTSTNKSRKLEKHFQFHFSTVLSRFTL